VDRKIIIFSGRSNPKFSNSICGHLNIELGRLEVMRFSDGELAVEVRDNVRGRDVFVVQSTSAPGNDHLMELLITLDALKRSSAWRITAVIPYFGYARQDRKLKPRVPITARLVADLITVAGANRVLTMDLHSGQIMGFFNTPVDNLNVLPVVLPYIKEKYGKDDIVVVSPDTGGIERARNLATRLNNSEIAVIDKRRSAPGQIAEMRLVGEVAGKTAILVDDIVDTGGTLIRAAELIRREGANKVIACCSHPVLSGEAVKRIMDSSLEEFIITDTIPVSRANLGSKITVISVSSLFADAINRIHSEDSISSLFA
jgi:ribose-phosphate pyrophosphokinase